MNARRAQVVSEVVTKVETEGVTLTMTLEQAKVLSRMASWNLSVPQAVYPEPEDGQRRLELTKILTEMRVALTVVEGQ